MNPKNAYWIWEEEVLRLPDVIEHEHVDEDIIQRLGGWVKEVAAGLGEARLRTYS